jgi:hypothetical protein
MGLLVFERGSLGPSTVTLMALLYVAICGGEELTVIVKVKLFPVKRDSATDFLVNDVKHFFVTGNNFIAVLVTNLTHLPVTSKTLYLSQPINLTLRNISSATFI